MNGILTPDQIADLAGISQICEELGNRRHLPTDPLGRSWAFYTRCRSHCCARL